MLLRSHKTVTNAINSEISDDIKPQYTYTELFNGFAIEAKYGDLEVIKGTEGVKNVFVSQKIEADFCMSNAFSMTHCLPSETMGHTGSGQVVAVIDSDFDVKHVAFSKEPVYTIHILWMLQQRKSITHFMILMLQRIKSYAFYDEDGSLMHTDIMQNQSVSAGEYAFKGDFDASTADYCKLFIWEDTKNVTPLDSAKVFDLEMYEIIQK